MVRREVLGGEVLAKKKPMPPALTSAAAGTKASNARESARANRAHPIANTARPRRRIVFAPFMSRRGPHATPLIGIAAAPVVYTAASRSV